MLNISNPQGNANQKHNEISFLYVKIRMAITEKTTDCKDAEKRKCLYIIGGNVNWYSHYGNGMETLQKFKYRTSIASIEI